MAVDLVMPQLGLTMTEGKILQWFKQPGEPFHTGEPLFEVETDKVNLEVEATEDGTLTEIVAPLNELLPVTTVIARYRRGSGAESPPAEAPRRVLASPRARRAAELSGIRLDSITGSGPNGQIVEQDVLQAAAAQAAAAQAAASPAPEPPVPEIPPLAAAAPVQQPAPAAPLSRMHRLTAERTAESFRTAPHFYLTREIDTLELVSLKRILSTALEKRGGPRLSLTDLFLRAMVLALASHPDVNASWRDGRIEKNPEIAVGVAIAVEEGLIVPVLRDLAAADITSIARRRTELFARARARRLNPGDFIAAGATLSNLGMFGVDQFQAILNPPESVIVAAGRVRERVVTVNGAPAVRPTCFCTLTADHRVLDGAQAARFLAGFAETLENPGLLLLP
jgi:pyruvate dehydrogenase E2 component (dihydrolipoamide acetyltransferase)